jgi:Zn-dependent peptidase ImmA (M78 family)
MTPTYSPSVLSRLRALIPQRGDITYDEALRVAELQATRLVEALRGPDALTEITIRGLPRIHVVHEDIGVSGMSHWTGQQWLITINSSDSAARQRFTLLHEFKHIVDHGSTSLLYQGSAMASGTEQSEHAADYFAGCALVPKRELKAAWGSGIQRIADLADHFGVSEQAIRVRLSQTKLDARSDAAPTARCARPISSSHYHSQRFRVARFRNRYRRNYA